MSIPRGALPATQDAYAGLVAALAARGIGATLADYGGTRTQADTTQILGFRQADYNRDHGLPLNNPVDTNTLNEYRPISPYGLSFHNYGAAFDLLIVTPGGYAVAGQLAPQFGLRWGGTFSNPDVRHFELAITLAEARQSYAAYTGGAQLPPTTSAFDLSSFLPGTSVDSPTLPDLSDLPPIEMIGYGDESDDSGEASGFLDNAPGLPDADAALYRQVGIFALVGVGLGVIVWALRRRFKENPVSFLREGVI